MEHEDRDRREWPEEDGGGSPPDAASADETAPSEIESWPSSDARRTEPDTTSAEPAGTTPEPADMPTEPGVGPTEPADVPTEPAAAPAEPAWPTEPPAAGSAADDAWPTTPPERGAEPVPEPASTPPPQEVEAYSAPEPSTTASDEAATAAHAVPAAASATGESTQCPRCGTENRPGLAFCRNCGQRLVAAGVASTVQRPGVPEGTQACPRCGTHNRAGVAFCQNCGANLRGTAEGYVPPAVATEEPAVIVERRGAVLGPVVLLIGLVGVVTAYLLPFAYGSGSLFERAFGSGGYGIGFWAGYPDVNAALVDQAYFGLAAPSPLLALLLLGLSVAGFVRAAPGLLQTIGLVVALLWSIGLAALFVLVELLGSTGGDLVAMLRDLTPAGIIFFLASLIVLIGTLTRFGRS